MTQSANHALQRTRPSPLDAIHASRGPGRYIGSFGDFQPFDAITRSFCPQSTQKDADLFSVCSACSAGRIQVSSGEPRRRCRLVTADPERLGRRFL